MSIQSIFRVAAVCTSLVLASCGGGSDSAVTAPSNAPSKVSLTGVVVDGYLGGATAFLDLNGNGSLDAGEPSAITNPDGTYDLSVTAAQAASGASIVVDVPATAIDADTGLAVGQRFVMSAPPVQQGTVAVISPMTTLVKSQMDNNASLTVASAEANVKAQIGLTGSNVDLLSDYVAAKNAGTVNATDYERVHSIARVTAQAVKNNMAAVETAANAAGSNASVGDIVALIVDQVLLELSNIALQVDLVPASTLDPAAALANTNVNNISTTNVAADITAIQVAANKPVITLNGSNQITIVQNQPFTDPGAVALSNIDGDISSKINVTSNVDATKVGFYTTAYDVTDAAGNKAAQVLRVVSVVAAADTLAPVITLNGLLTVSLNSGTPYVDAGAVLDDPYATLTVSGYVNAAIQATYTITYNAVDGAGNKAITKTRTVKVVDGTPPAVFQLLGSANVSVIQGGTFTEPGVFAWDATDGDISNQVVITGGLPNTTVVGVYTRTYNVSDAAGNAAATLTRTINVTTETVPPVVTAPTNITVEATGFSTPVTLGTATVTDNVSTNLTATATPVGPYAVGVYTITWTATDTAGNVGTATQTVTVEDTTPPSITAPADITIAATSPATAVTLGAPTGVLDLTSTPNVFNDAPAGGFPVGITTVTWTAIDAYNNTATAIQTVTVTDNVSPVVIAPASASLLDTNTAGIAAFLNGATATDNIDGTLTVTNNAPVPLPTGTTTVTFSAIDAAGNPATATALITIAAAPIPGAVNNVPVTVRTDAVDQNTGQVIGTPGPIANAVVVVDGVEFITDVNGNTSVPGLDVGVHDVHVFANNYVWSSMYGYTSEAAGSTFTVDPISTAGSVQNPSPVTGQYYDSYVSFGVNLPAGYVAPPYSKIEMTLTDVYANAAVSEASVYAYDPYTQAPLYRAIIPTNFIPAGTTFAGTLSTSEVSCDLYGFNCTKTNFADVVQNFTTETSATAYSGLPPAVNVAITNAALPVPTPVANNVNSRVVMDMNFSNTVLTPGTLDIYAQNVGAAVVYSVTDIYGNVQDYSGYISTSYNAGVSLFDPYGNYIGLSPATVASSQVVLDFFNVAPGAILNGNLYVVETINSWQITNYLDLGPTAITTTAAPVVYTGNIAVLPGVINAAFNVTPVLPPVANTAVNNSQVDLTAVVTNSLYHDPYSARPVTGYTYIEVMLATAPDAFGYRQIYNSQLWAPTSVDIYGAVIASGAELSGALYTWDLPVGTTITGNLTATEVVYDNITGTQSEVQYIDMGLQTFTTGPSSQGSLWKAGLYIPSQVAPAAPTALNIVFPVVPPTPVTTLVLQSVTPPTGMVVNNINVSDAYSYFDYRGSWNGALTFPNTFTSIAAPQGVLNVRVDAYDSITGYNWGKSVNQVVQGSTVNITTALNTMGTVAANQQGNVINYNFGGAASPATLMRFDLGGMWTLFVDGKSTSLTLPPVPLSITNTFVIGQQYQLGFEMNVLGNYTFNTFMKVFTGNSVGRSIFGTLDTEYLADYTGVPYTY